MAHRWSFGTIRGFSSHQALSYKEAIKIRKEKLSPAVTGTSYYRKPLFVYRGSMQYLFDTSGNKYLDLFGGIVTVSVGHCHPKVNEALKQQVDRLWHTTSIYMTSPMLEYVEKLTKKLPDNLKVWYFVNSGSEANDLALLMTKIHTGNFDIVSLRNGYHGLTQAVGAVTNLSTWKHPAPLNFGVHRTLNPDPYKGPWGGKNCRDSVSQVDRDCDCSADECMACDNYVDQLEDLLIYGVPKKGVAGIIIEPIQIRTRPSVTRLIKSEKLRQGVGGCVQYPKNYMEKAFQLIRNHGGVCIVDEVQTGFGRLGDKFWGFQTHNVVPDIVTMAKGIGNGFPLGAVVTTPEIAKSLTHAAHFNTFGGNPLACTVASAVLDVIEEENLQERCRTVGSFFLSELMKLKAKSSVIGDVRGKGLMIGIELVSDKEKRNPLEREKVSDIIETLKDCGILVGRGGLHANVVRIKPPMCVTLENAKEALSVFKDILV